MKWLLLKLINLYQITPTHMHSACRFTPTCSEYMKTSIIEYGSIKGVYLGIKRLLRCHPFGKYGYDPVPKKEVKMKKIIICLLSIFILSGCENTINFKDTKTYTTLYPIKYAVSYMYKDYSSIESIYPNEIDISSYKLTNKQKNKYSKGETFVYAGLFNEGSIAKDLLNINSDIQIIDATKGMNYTNDIAELWLDPSNYLMVARNIKESLIDYNENVYASKEIEKNYEKLKEQISELDVMLYNLGKNGGYTTLLVSNNLFNYLTKYNIEIISLDPKGETIDKSYTNAKNMIALNNIKFIYTIKGEKLDGNIEKLISENNLEKIEITLINNLTNEEAKNNETYITLMKKIIDEYKKELYK